MFGCGGKKVKVVVDMVVHHTDIYLGEKP